MEDKKPDLTIEVKEPPKEDKPNPLLDVLENNVDIDEDSVEIKVVIPFD